MTNDYHRLKVVSIEPAFVPRICCSHYKDTRRTNTLFVGRYMVTDKKLVGYQPYKLIGLFRRVERAISPGVRRIQFIIKDS